MNKATHLVKYRDNRVGLLRLPDIWDIGILIEKKIKKYICFPFKLYLYFSNNTNSWYKP